MDDRVMRSRIDEVLGAMRAEALEERIAPVKCEKNPDAPECRVDTLYGIDQPMYGVDTP